jgi:microcystin-dependent protein
LFSLLYRTYGGDGVSTFALPDLRGRIPVGQGAGMALGQMGGREQVALTGENAPSHTHVYQPVTTIASSRGPGNTMTLARLPAGTAYRDPYRSTTMVKPGANSGGAAHENRMPYQCVTFIIAFNGVYPTRS